MNLKEIKELITLMNENSLTELEIEREGLRVKLRKVSDGGSDQRVEVVPLRQEFKELSKAEEVKSQKREEASKKYIEVKAPMVGTFYEAPSPDSPPYVEVGGTMHVGQVLCIIEAMKLMNEIKSEVKGKIVEKLVENAQPIEYGQVLFLVEPV